MHQKVRLLLAPHKTATVGYLGWAGIKNGNLLDAAEAAGFDVLLTGDQSLAREQDLSGRKIAVVAVTAISFTMVKAGISKIMVAIEAATRGQYVVVDIGRFSRR